MNNSTKEFNFQKDNLNTFFEINTERRYGLLRLLYALIILLIIIISIIKFILKNILINSYTREIEDNKNKIKSKKIELKKEEKKLGELYLEINNKKRDMKIEENVRNIKILNINLNKEIDKLYKEIELLQRKLAKYDNIQENPLLNKCKLLDQKIEELREKPMKRQ